MANNNRTKFFHASRHRLTWGTVLTPQGAKPTFSFSEEWVYLTTSPEPHLTLLEQEDLSQWHVYEVRPLDDLHCGRWNDLLTKRAVIVRYVGQVGHNHKSSYVRFQDVKYSGKVRGRGFIGAVARKKGDDVSPNLRTTWKWKSEGHERYSNRKKKRLAKARKARQSRI